MFQPVKIAPSILSADFMNLQRDIEAIQAGGADVLVCGSAVCGADDPAAAIAQVTQAAEAARAAALASKEA